MFAILPSRGLSLAIKSMGHTKQALYMTGEMWQKQRQFWPIAAYTTLALSGLYISVSVTIVTQNWNQNIFSVYV